MRRLTPPASAVLAVLSGLRAADVGIVMSAVSKRVKREIFRLVFSRVNFPTAAWTGMRNVLFGRVCPFPAQATGYREVCFDMAGNRVDSPDPQIEQLADTILALLYEYGFAQHEMWSVVQELNEFFLDLNARVTLRDLLAHPENKS